MTGHTLNSRLNIFLPMNRASLSSCTIFTFFPDSTCSIFEFLGFRDSLDAISVPLGQGWRISGTRGQNSTRNSLLSQISIFPWPASPDCTMGVYTLISDCVQTVYELPLLPNSTAVEHYYTNWERCAALTGYLSLGCWPGGHVTLDSMFYNVLCKPEIIAAQLLRHFLPHRIPRGGLC